jgi:hypothetical protein
MLFAAFETSHALPEDGRNFYIAPVGVKLFPLCPEQQKIFNKHGCLLFLLGVPGKSKGRFGYRPT